MIESRLFREELELVKNMLSEKVDVIKRKYEEVKSKRLNLDAKAKSLIKEGRIEDAEVLISKNTG